MYIKKFQVGGVAYTPFIPQGAAQTQAAQSSSSGDGNAKSSSSKKSKLEDSIIDILKENGIPSDVNAFLKIANSFLSNSQSLSNSILFGGSDNTYSMADLIRLQQYANDIKFNKGIYDNAVKNLGAEDAWSDYALDSNGNFYVYEDGKLNTMSASEVSKVINGESDKKPAFLTYSQLAGLREQGLAFDSGVLKDLEGAVGNKTMSDHFIGLIQKFSKNTTGSVDTKQSVVARGLEYIIAAGPDGYYKTTVTDQIKDINAACVTVWQNLTGAEQNNIKRSIALSGKNPNSAESIYGEVAKLIYQYAEYSPDVKPIDSPSGSGSGGSGSSGNSGLAQNNYLQMFANGRLEFAGYRTFAPHHDETSDKGAMEVATYVVGAPIDTEHHTLGTMNLKNFRQKCWAIQGSNSENFTIGDTALTSDQLSALVYDGYSELKVAMLPVTHDDKGRMIPNFALIDKYDEIKAAFDKNPNMNDMAFAELCRKNGVDPNLFDKIDGNIEIKDTVPFLTFTAIVGEDTMGDIDEFKKYLEPVDKVRGKRMVDEYNRSVQYGTTNITKDSKKQNNLPSSSADELYETNVFIPVPSSFRGMMASGIGEYVKKEDLTDYARRSEARRAEVGFEDAVRDAHPDIDGHNLGQFRE